MKCTNSKFRPMQGAPPPPPRVINIFEAYTRKILIDMKNLIAEEKEIKIVVKNLVVEHLTVVNCSLHVIVRVQRKSFFKGCHTTVHIGKFIAYTS